MNIKTSLGGINSAINTIISYGSIVVNDYIITLEQKTDGYELSVRKGSQEQKVFLYGLTDERLQLILDATDATENYKNQAHESEIKTSNYREQALQYRNNSQIYAIDANESADDARDSEISAEKSADNADKSAKDAEHYAMLAKERSYGVSIEENKLIFSNIENNNS